MIAIPASHVVGPIDVVADDNRAAGEPGGDRVERPDRALLGVVGVE
jgi:hypothetical protein